MEFVKEIKRHIEERFEPQLTYARRLKEMLPSAREALYLTLFAVPAGISVYGATHRNIGMVVCGALAVSFVPIICFEIERKSVSKD